LFHRLCLGEPPLEPPRERQRNDDRSDRQTKIENIDPADPFPDHAPEEVHRPEDDDQSAQLLFELIQGSDVEPGRRRQILSPQRRPYIGCWQKPV
jgi:hypothetical protein